MIPDLVGVAISTTGDKHRLGFLETSLRLWRRALPLGAVIVVTVDGDLAACARVLAAVDKVDGGRVGGNVIRVGQQLPGVRHFRYPQDGRLGVAANKNTGIEYLMDAGVEHLFLSDDDCGPKSRIALSEHIHTGFPHSMVCWGKPRHPRIHAQRPRPYTEWSWPRGVMLYVHSRVIEAVGGMEERFGIGGHEHAEWSRRIHQAGFTPVPFLSPSRYAGWGLRDNIAMGAEVLWHCEDYPPRADITSIKRPTGYWDNAEQIMLAKDGDTSFVAYSAHDNGRASATLCTNLTGQGAGGDK